MNKIIDIDNEKADKSSHTILQDRLENLENIVRDLDYGSKASQLQIDSSQTSNDGSDEEQNNSQMLKEDQADEYLNPHNENIEEKLIEKVENTSNENEDHLTITKQPDLVKMIPEGGFKDLNAVSSKPINIEYNQTVNPIVFNPIAKSPEVSKSSVNFKPVPNSRAKLSNLVSTNSESNEVSNNIEYLLV